ncbi:MAG TPA: hypothetical protein VFW21_09795, partial [Mycobacterium sp.]|nr:hypothetical protein [Mycobacterium sp.]
MTAPLICIPQWWDRLALHGAVTTPVHMTRGAPLPTLRNPRPTLVAGTIRTPTADGQPGELIVAGGFDTAGGPTASAAPLLLTALRRLRLSARLGSLGTEHPVTAAVDAQIVALHAVAATSAVAMYGAGAARPLVTALRALRSAAPAIDQWAAATGNRDILLASPRSFCAGVERAVLTVERAMRRFGTPVYVRRQIVHNR